jgi:hypothetical protein
LTGTFQNVSGSPSCNDCPIGFSNGGTKEESCTGCQKGRFQDAIREAKCKECPAASDGKHTSHTSGFAAMYYRNIAPPSTEKWQRG